MVVETTFEGLNAKTMSREVIMNHVMNKLNISQKGLEKFDFKIKYQDQTKTDFKLKY